MANRKPKQGRVTPPKSARAAGAGASGRGDAEGRGGAGGRGGRGEAPGAARRRLGGPNQPIEGPVQPGKRPSNPATLLIIALAWIACGIFAFVYLSAGWKLIPTIVFIGIGLLFLRGAAATVSRRAGNR